VPERIGNTRRFNLGIPLPDLFQGHRLPEKHPSYPAIRLNASWRVIRCKDNVQWIVQRLHSGPETAATARWEGRAYCPGTREALIRCCEA
jgi:hypothetical protein